MADKNPFEVLGLNQGILKNLSETEIRGLVKAMYKELARIYHPDRNRSKKAEERFKEISAAYQLIGPNSDRDTFDMLLANFNKLKSGQKKIQELEKILREEKAESDKFFNLLLESFSFYMHQQNPAHILDIGDHRLRIRDELIYRNTPGTLKMVSNDPKLFFYELIAENFGFKKIYSDGREEVFAVELADLSGTIHYEFLTRLNPLIKRVVV